MVLFLEQTLETTTQLQSKIVDPSFTIFLFVGCFRNVMILNILHTPSLKCFTGHLGTRISEASKQNNMLELISCCKEYIEEGENRSFYSPINKFSHCYITNLFPSLNLTIDHLFKMGILVSIDL